MASHPTSISKRLRAETTTNGRDLLNHALDVSARSLSRDPNDMATNLGQSPGGLEEPEMRPAPSPVEWKERPRMSISDLPGLDVYAARATANETEDDRLLSPLTPLWDIWPTPPPGNGSHTTNRTLRTQYKLPGESEDRPRVLRPDFRSQPIVSERESTPQNCRGASKWTELWHLCELQDIAERKKFWISLYNTFVSLVNSPKLDGATDVRAAVQSAKARQATLKQYRVAGQMAAAQAHYIPCRKATASNGKGNLDERFIVESKEIRRIAIESGALDASEILLVDQTWQRIVKPPPEAGLQAVILYNAETVKDNTIKQSDIFGGGIYNAEILTAQASEISQQVLALEMAQLVQHLQYREGFERGLDQFGAMVKTSIGATATNGILHTPQVPTEPEGKSAWKKARIVQQQKLRKEVKANSAFIQSCNYMLLEGFMPMLAKEQMLVATRSNLINSLGFPNTASFGSFAYGASPHTDRDDTVTMGWVSARSKKILDDESNFFWSEYRIILELAEHCHWVWNAQDDPHGTTLSRLVARQPKSWKTVARNQPDEGQWSRANVITRAASQAAQRVQ
ncbi:unnamed protein product [Peniophora sp. CBMAI 1063]|nr:unnamed protein product [Peniophora sp. CBMAI 1063]